MMLPKIKSANALSGEIPLKSDLFEGFTCNLRQTEKEDRKQGWGNIYFHFVTELVNNEQSKSWWLKSKFCLKLNIIPHLPPIANDVYLFWSKMLMNQCGQHSDPTWSAGSGCGLEQVNPKANVGNLMNLLYASPQAEK